MKSKEQELNCVEKKNSKEIQQINLHGIRRQKGKIKVGKVFEKLIAQFTKTECKREENSLLRSWQTR